MDDRDQFSRKLKHRVKFQVPALPFNPFCPSLPGFPGIPGGPTDTKK